MSVIQVLKTKRLWIGLAVMAVCMLALIGLGAMLIQKEILPESAEMGWICAGYFLSALTGAMVAVDRKGGSMTYALTAAVLVLMLLLLVTASACGGLDMSEGGWKLLACPVIGCLAAGFLKAGGGKGRRKKRTIAKVKRPARGR